MIQVFNSTRADGIMSSHRRFYPYEMTDEDIVKSYREKRILLGEKKEFDGNKIVVQTQDLDKHTAGHCVDATEMLLDTKETDWYKIDIPADVLLVRSNVKGVVLAYPVADCAVLIAEVGENIMAITHCGARETDRMLPFQFVDAIREKTDAKPKNITIYIGPCAGRNSYGYETYPEWANNKDAEWDNFIRDNGGIFYIDLRMAIQLQLYKAGINWVKLNTADTITDPNYYSNYASYYGDYKKNGRFLVGGYFIENSVNAKCKRKIYCR